MPKTTLEKIWDNPSFIPVSVVGMIGNKYGRWTVKEFSTCRQMPNGKYSIMLLCKCDCGKEKVVMKDHIKNGTSKSCGCLISESTIKRLTKHGHAPLNRKKSITYTTWQSMNRRCVNPNDNHFYLYGDRGIKVCERWRDFKNFLEDMGEKEPNMSLERIDNNKDYCPENCKWIPRKDQSKNRRYNWTVELNGEKMTAREASRKLNLNKSYINNLLVKKGKHKQDVQKIIPGILNLGLGDKF